ncbi:MAG: cysteine desulfurase family protein [Bacteroidota bacterium]
MKCRVARPLISSYINAMNRIYLDYSATTPLDPRVLDAMRPHFLENFGNASSVHETGRKARTVLEESRETLAQLIGTTHDTLFFTSGGTEADNFAVTGIARALKPTGRDHIVVSALEHYAVLHSAFELRKNGWQVDTIRVNPSGVTDLNELKSLVSERTALVSIMHANNETGVIQPVREAADIAHAQGAFLHTDAVQTFGKIRVWVKDLSADLISLSAHKIYGPKGIGALFIRKGIPIQSLLVGGGQEQNRRAGTENVPLAAGFAAAGSIAQEVMDSELQRTRILNSELRGQLTAKFPEIMFNGADSGSLPTIVNVSFDSSMGVDGEALIMGMDLRGISVTSGSACTSGTLEPSHVLMAMGRNEATARATIRFSLGRPTTLVEIETAVDALADVLSTIRSSVSR